MKTKLLICLLFITHLCFSQSVIITAIVDGGDCRGVNTPRFVELYINGTVDVTNLRLQMQFDSSKTDTWTVNTKIGSGFYTDQFLYLVDQKDIFNIEFPGISTPSTLSTTLLPKFLRGGDKIRLIDVSNKNKVIDQYGITNVNGIGTSWEYTNSYSKRKDATKPSPNFTESEWEIKPIESLTNLGTCKGLPSLNTTIKLQSYKASSTVLSINSFDIPNNNAFAVYPNPIENGQTLFFENGQHNLNKVLIYNLNGSIEQEFTLNSSGKITLSNLAAGTYFLEGIDTKDEIIGYKKIILKN